MKRLIFDIETNGLLDELTKVHCLVTLDPDSGEVLKYVGDEICPRGTQALEEADVLIGHNIQGFDIPALQKVYSQLAFEPKATIRDTLIISRLIWPDIKVRDFNRLRKHPEFPKNLIGRHSLEAWGHRLGVHKGEYKGGWDTFTPEMLDYCVQDVVGPTAALWKLIESKQYSAAAIELEQRVCVILERQEKNGVGFDQEGALKLLTETLIPKRDAVSAQLKSTFPPFKVRSTFTPKRANKKKGWVAGVPIERVKEIPFNPGSRQHIGRAMIEHRGWKPEKFTPTGLPVVEEGVFTGFDAPEVPLIEEFLLLEKRIGQLSTGEKAWLKLEKNGVIYGRVDHNGAVTGRMTHNSPNMTQVPKVKNPYGKECRGLFRPTRPGWVIVGADASGIELRCLAHYMARWDDGAYVKVVLEKDVHTENALILKIHREDGKTFIYAFLYGAGDEKLGRIVLGGRCSAAEAKALGKKLKKRFLSGLSALKYLVQAVAKAAASGYLRGLDGRRIPVRSAHSALNTLLQGAGAAIMKLALIVLDDMLQVELGLRPGVDYEFMLNVHDEWQIECRPELAERIGEAAVEAIKRAGRVYKLRCPLAGEWKTGKTWADTH